MKLLTDKQIGQILDMCNCANSTHVRNALSDWNNKQAPVGTDWEIAPADAVRVKYELTWYDSNNKMIRNGHFHTAVKELTPYVHSEMLAKYAEVAARRSDPWVEFQWRSTGQGDWSRCIQPMRFYASYQYRHKV